MTSYAKLRLNVFTVIVLFVLVIADLVRLAPVTELQVALLFVYFSWGRNTIIINYFQEQEQCTCKVIVGLRSPYKDASTEQI